MIAARQTIMPFLGAVRRRLWLLEAARAAALAFWLVSIGLLLLALVHVTLVSVPQELAAAIVAAGIVWLLLRSLSRQPGIGAAAAAADRHFGGRELMTTAAECLRRTQQDDSGAAGIVLEQAGHAADDWSPLVKKTLRPARRAHLAIAMVALFVAIMLLAAIDEPALQREAATAETPAVLSISSEEVSDELATIRRELVEETAAIAPAGQPATDRAREHVQADQETAAAAERIESDEEPMPGNNMRAATESGELAGDAVSLPGDGTAARDADLATGDSIAISLDGRGAATSASTGRDYRDTAAELPNRGVPVLPARAPAQGRTSTLTPAQAAYAARYLESGGEDDE